MGEISSKWWWKQRQTARFWSRFCTSCHLYWKWRISNRNPEHEAVWHVPSFMSIQEGDRRPSDGGRRHHISGKFGVKANFCCAIIIKRCFSRRIVRKILVQAVWGKAQTVNVLQIAYSCVKHFTGSVRLQIQEVHSRWAVKCRLFVRSKNEHHGGDASQLSKTNGNDL